MELPFNLTIIEKCHISPPPDSIIPPISLPLTFLDIPWLFHPSNQTLFFFQKPPPKTTITTVINHLKQSLSLTLHHFHPLAGNLSVPPPPAEPYILYKKGDSVSLTIAETNTNSNHLSSHNPRNLTNLYSLLPKLISPCLSRDTHVTNVLPLLAIQITVFGDSGFCIGITVQHVAADERTLDQFMRCWTSICKSLLLNKDSFFGFKFSSTTPWFDRSIILDTFSLKSTFLKKWWNQMNSYKNSHEETKKDNNMVQSTFVLKLSDINMIKNHILVKCRMINEDPPIHLSPYVSACSYIWICLLKVGEIIDTKDGCQYLGFNAGGITRLGYDVPSNYFGNCIGFGRCKGLENELLSENGVVFAAKCIGKEIKRLDKDVLGGGENWISDWNELNIRILGSPKVDSYGLDFGWGKVVKVEKISSDFNYHGNKVNVISLSGSREFNGGMEIGVVLSRDRMKAFSSVFNDGLRNLN
uniref:anthocyanin 5-aromatic acyltransferase-like n=1 Tax=Erigeron canadensis TaxID=72917 RepID=UPI001CB992C6|nr:anthocyanin 5-aromatic acyltransferase-like [Erigeron canadensis]